MVLPRRIPAERSVVATGTVQYTYDEAGHLLGEYDGIGTLIVETVWMRNHGRDRVRTDLNRR
jgi:hypothetical protein